MASLAARSASTMRSSSSLGSRWVRRFPRSMRPGSTIRATTSTVWSAAAATSRRQPAHLHRSVRQRRVGLHSAEDPTAYVSGRCREHVGARRAAANALATVMVLRSAALLRHQCLGGTRAPDIVGDPQVDQAWGLFQLSAAAHNNHAGYYGATEVTGHPDDKWGWAVQAALQIKNIPTGAGDTINFRPSTRTVQAGTTSRAWSATNFAMYGGTSLGWCLPEHRLCSGD